MTSITAGPGLEVVPGYQPYISTTGIVRWNGLSKRLEVMEQNGWTSLEVSPTHISIDARVNNILNWASIKMAEEQRLQVLLDKHPGLKDLQEKFNLMLALVKEHENDQ